MRINRNIKPTSYQFNVKTTRMTTLLKLNKGVIMLLKLENIIFDDFVIDDGEQMTRWTQVCESHSQQFKGNKTDCRLSSCPGEPICGVDGCEYIAEYYLDFIDGDYHEL